MNDAETTPPEPGQPVDETAVDLLDDAVRRARRPSSALRRAIREAQGEERAAVVADTAEFGRKYIRILEDHVRLLDQLARRDADTVRDLKAMTDERRPRSWFAWANGAIAAVAGAGVPLAWSQDHPNLALASALTLALAAYLANTPLPSLRARGSKSPKGSP